MNDDDFPVDAGTLGVIFPCFMVRNEEGTGFACHALDGGGFVIAVLTDEGR